MEILNMKQNKKYQGKNPYLVLYQNIKKANLDIICK